MYISDYINRDRVNGVGVRTSMYISGCLHRCKGCFSYETWNFRNGKQFDEEYRTKLIKDLKSPQVKGRLTILGGDGMFSPKEMFELLESLRKEIPYLDVWFWTGFTIEDIDNDKLYSIEKEENTLWRRKLLTQIDTLIDGKFDKDLYAPDIPFRGSSNQRIINLKEIREGRS